MSALSGKIAIVTGGSRGIGATIATRLAADGAAVAVNYASHQAEANDVVQKIVQAGGKAIAIQADVSKTEDVRLLFKEVIERFEGLDMLINNAGATHIRPMPIAALTGQLTGQLAGTVVRATGVPHDLFGGVEGSEEIFQIARRFAKFVSAREK
jgi:NAD(P)-dependent dehydrogenase (short-subunit alcohol dehydrogenase family)